MLFRSSRLVMVIDALLLLGLGAYILAKRDEFLAYVGLAIGPASAELAGLLGIVLLGLAVHQATTSRNAGDPAFRRAALCSVLMQGTLAASLYLESPAPTTMRTVLAGVCAFFAVIYLVTLPIKPVGYRDDAKA